MYTVFDDQSNAMIISQPGLDFFGRHIIGTYFDNASDIHYINGADARIAWFFKIKFLAFCEGTTIDEKSKFYWSQSFDFDKTIGSGGWGDVSFSTITTSETSFAIMAIGWSGLVVKFIVKYDPVFPKINNLKEYYKDNETINATITETNLASVRFSWKTPSVSNITEITNSSSFSDGKYTITVNDKADNQTIQSFIIDKTLPVISSSVSNNGYTNKAFTINVKDSNYDALYYRYSSGTTVATATKSNTKVTSTSFTITPGDTYKDGWYSFLAVDKAGNESVYNVCLDTTTPVVQMYEKSSGQFSDGQNVNELVRFQITDYNSIYTFAFQKKTVAGTYENTTFDWTGFLDKTIYYDKRELDFNNGLYTRNVFYTTAEINEYILNKELQRVSTYNNYTSSVSGNIIDSEKSYVTTGATYYIYETDQGVRYIFFDLTRLKTYISTVQISQYKGNGTNYFFEEGDFKLTVTDAAGNSIVKYFVTDFTAPTITIYLDGNVTTKQYYGLSDVIRVVTNDINIKDVLLGSNSLTTDETVTIKNLNETTYKLVAKDKAGNETSVTLIIDKTKPVLSTNKSYYKKGEKLTLTIKENNKDTITLDNKIVTILTYDVSETTFAEGLHTFIVSDKAGNTESLTFTVDYTSPIIRSDKNLYGIADTVNVTVDDEFLASFYVNNSSYTSNIASTNGSATFTFLVENLQEKIYSYRVVDLAGNESSIEITIDKTPPEFVEIKAFYNQGDVVDITVHSKEKNTYVVYFDNVETTQKKLYSVGYGSHELRVVDAAGNSTSVTFFYGTTQPKISIKRNGAVYSDIVYVMNSETITLHVVEPQYNYSTLNGENLVLTTIETGNYTYTWNTTQLVQGNYRIDVFDNNQNLSSITFVVDKTAPTITLRRSGIAQDTGFYAKAGQTIKITANDNFALNRMTIAGGEEICTGQNYSYDINTNDLDDGIYDIKIYDKAGNYSVASFIVDKTAPIITATKNNIMTVLTFCYLAESDVIAFVFTDYAIETKEIDYTTISKTTFNASDFDDDVHSLKVVDKAGNETRFDFFVDKTTPKIELKKAGVTVDNNSQFKASTTISVTVNEKNKEIAYFDEQETTATYWNSNDLFEGIHTYVVYDKAGNYSSVSFVVDHTPAQVVLNKTINTDGKYYYTAQDYVILTITEINDYRILFDGSELNQLYFEAYSKNDGEYTLQVQDAASNLTTVRIVIDKTTPYTAVRIGSSGELMTEGLFVSEKAALQMLFTDTNKDYWMLDDVVLTSMPTLSSLDDGIHIIKAYDKAGNFATATFTVDKTAPVLNILNKTASDNGEYYYNESETVYFSYFDTNENCVLLDGQIIDLTELPALSLSEALHVIEIVDKAGNISSLSFIIDKTAPTIIIKKSGITVETGTYFKDGSISIVSSDLYKYAAYINDADTTSTYWSISELFEGLHTYTAYDRAGNYSSIEFIVDKTTPELFLNNDMHSDGKTYYSMNQYISIDVRETYEYTVSINQELITTRNIHTDTLTDGIYVITVEDQAGNIKTASFVIDKTTPYIAVRIGSSGELMTEGLFVSEKATLQMSFTDTNKDYWMLDDVILTIMPTLSLLNDGLHTIKAYDKAGNFATATFTVDKTAPTLNLLNKTAYNEGKYYYNENETVYISYFDTNENYILLDGQIIDLTEIPALSLSEALHVIEIVDKAGNTSSLSFIIDKTAPEIDLKKNGLTVNSNSEFFKSDQIVSVATKDTNGILLVELNNESTVFKSWNVYTFADGVHTISVYDLAENMSQVSFIVDNTPPQILMESYYKQGDEITINIIDNNNYIVKLNNSEIEISDIIATKLSESEHTLIVIDEAGNTTEKKFTIDLTNPILLTYKNSQLVVDTNELSNLYIKAGEIISIYVEDVNLEDVLFDTEPVLQRMWFADVWDDRLHTIKVYDKAGNFSSVEFTIDKVAPVFTINDYYILGESLVLDIFDSNPFIVTIDNIDVNQERIFDIDSYSEGKHHVLVKDLAGNVLEKEFIVDLQAPKITINGYAQDGLLKNVIDDTSFGQVTVTLLDISHAGKIYYSLNSSEFKYIEHRYIKGVFDYTFTDEIANSGEWTIYAEDVNGYVTQKYVFYADFSVPAYSLEGINTIIGTTLYTNQAFKFIKQNQYAMTVYNRNGGDSIRTNNQEVAITADSEGVYTFYIRDAFYRQSDLITIILQANVDFSNITSIMNSYKVNSWYTVTLPYKIYGSSTRPNIAGTYSFIDYDTALAFAVEKEREYRVVITDNQTSYVSISNETVYVNYDTEEALSQAVVYYASKYISDRNLFSYIKDRNSYNIISPVESLTVNNPELPVYLNEYSDLPIYLVQSTFKPVDNSGLSKSTVSLMYVGNYIELITNRVTIYVNYGESLYNALETAGNLYGGYYVYKEIDLCGNIQTALLLIDFAEPYFNVQIDRGDSSEILTINKDSISSRNGVFYVTNFKITELLDAVDNDFVGIYIASSSYYKTFTKGDILPELNSTLGAGKYTIIIYDRSYNLLTFDVIVAGKNPSWFYSSLSSSQTSLSIYIYKNDQYTAFTSLKIVKIKSDGSYSYLTTDDDGTIIDASTLSYVFKTGGKYTCIIEDIYGRTTTFEPVFFEKGLPTGVLSGVTNNGVTKNTVSFSYSDAFSLEIFNVFASGATVEYIGVIPDYVANERTYVATFNPTMNEKIQYLLVLYSNSDRGIYIEYSFTLDSEPPIYVILNIDGNELLPNTDTNMPFCVDWGEETATVKVKKPNGVITTVSKNSFISDNGLYQFTITDKVGNVATFNMYLDSEVLYSLSNTFITIADNYFLSNYEQIITILEPINSSVCVFDNNFISIGEKLNTTGVYYFRIEDLYGNIVEFNLELDFIAPVFTLENVTDGLSNKEVIVSTDDTKSVLIETSSNFVTTKKTLTQNYVFYEEGTYYVKATDKAGNISKISFIIDKHVNYTSNISNGLAWSNKTQVKFNEDVIQNVTLNGESIDSANEYSTPGTYNIIATDKATNSINVYFVILPSKIQILNLEIPEGFNITRLEKNLETLELPGEVIRLEENGKYTITFKHVETNNIYTFSITVDNEKPTVEITEKSGIVSFSKASKQNVNATLYKDGTLVEDFTLSESIKEKGTYVLVLTDELGNAQTYEFTVTPSLDPFTIILIIICSTVVLIILILTIKGRRIKTA
jgi:hypothetical protein